MLWNGGKEGCYIIWCISSCVLIRWRNSQDHRSIGYRMNREWERGKKVGEIRWRALVVSLYRLEEVIEKLLSAKGVVGWCSRGWWTGWLTHKKMFEIQKKKKNTNQTKPKANPNPRWEPFPTKKKKQTKTKGGVILWGDCLFSWGLCATLCHPANREIDSHYSFMAFRFSFIVSFHPYFDD